MELSELLSPQATLRMDVRASADRIEALLEGALKPAPVGIYRIDQLEPALVEEKAYYQNFGTTTVELGTIATSARAIYDADGKLVIPASFMANQNKFLSTSPMLPYRGSLIVLEVINTRLFEFALCSRKRAPTLHSRVIKQVNSHDIITQDIINLITDCCTQLLNDLDVFIEHYEWNIFFSRLEGSMIRVDRAMDWRAYEWESKYGTAFRSGKYV